MKKKIVGLLFVIGGLILMAGSVVAEVAWLSFCFGTVIIGVLMIFLAPLILFAPLTIGFSSGLALWGSGFVMLSED